METKRFKVSRQSDHRLLVEGLERIEGIENWYLSENSVGLRNGYRYSDTVTVNILHTVDAEYKNTIVDCAVVPHKLYTEEEISNIAENGELDQEFLSDSNSFKISHDGLYRVDHIIIPTNEWLEMAKESPEDLAMFSDVYYYDLKSEELKHWKPDGTVEVIGMADLLEVVPSTINTKVQLDGPAHVFLMDHLLQCFNKVIEDLLRCVRSSSNCSSPEIVAKERNRDLLWMFINAIKYNLGWKRTLEAQRLLEQLNGCNTICSNTNTTKKYTDCGC